MRDVKDPRHLFPTLGVGLLDFELNSSPRPELFSSPSLLLAHPWNPKCPRNAQLQSVPGVPDPRKPQPQSLPRVPDPRVSPECPAPSLLPQSLPGVPNPESP